MNRVTEPIDVPADDLIRLVDRWRPVKVVVVGDFMVDRYTYGDAQRLSPDAPVPVLVNERTELKAGGASNVCLDLRALRCEVACVGVVGRDATAHELRGALEQAGCDVSALLPVEDRPTTVKHSFIGLAQHRHPQKMFRVDSENRLPIGTDVARQLAEHTARLLDGAAVLCIEDYHKGAVTPEVCAQVIAAARERHIPVLVDPAAISDYRKYRGATCITPNRTEAALATGRRGDDAGLDNVRAMAGELLEALELASVVLTLDKQGALLLERGTEPVLLPTVARQVYDVTGAGDMVLAMLAASLGNGADWRTAVMLANIAAGLEVEKFGVVPIELDEVLVALLRRRHEDLGKERTLDQLLPELHAYRRQGRKIAFTNGCFDILHAGHVSYLRQARRCGDLLVVAVNSDSSIRRIKGADRPLNREHDRLMVLSELESINYLILFDDDTPLRLIEAIRPDVLVKGADYRKEDVVGADIVESHGGEVVLVELVEGRSTTNLIGRIRGKGVGA